MRINYPYLKDMDFLKYVDKQQIQEIFIKITVLNWQEQPLQEIQGVATGGNININGNSAVRRSANITLAIADETDYQLNGFSIKELVRENKKISLEIGYTNFTEEYKEFPILWFPQGLFVITQASFSHSLSGLTISLQLQDKMCLLNGSFGGVIPAQTTFDSYSTIDSEGKYFDQKVPLSQMVQEAMNHWGNEPLENIVISDIPEKTRQRVMWDPPVDEEGKAEPLIFYLSEDFSKWLETPEGEEYLKSKGEGYRKDNCKEGTVVYIQWGKGENDFWIDEKFKELFFDYWANETSDYKIRAPKSLYTYKNGTAGFQYVDSVYLQDLVINGGGNVAEVLEKIKNYLGNYEYFYKDNLFYFQEKKNYLNTTQATLDIEKYKEIEKNLSEDKTEGTATERENILQEILPIDVQGLNSGDYFFQPSNEKSVYQLDDSSIITSFSNTPKYEMIKNDFVVWGERKSSNGAVTPVRFHLAFDKKPKVGNTYEVVFWDEAQEIKNGEVVIEQSVKMPHRYPSKAAFPLVGIEGLLYYAEEEKAIYRWDVTVKPEKYVQAIGAELTKVTTTDWRTELFLSGMQAESQDLIPNEYYKELKNEWTKIYDIENQKFKDKFILNPGLYNYYLDFIETPNLSSRININEIGRRTKFLNDKNINCLFEEVELPFVYIKDVSENASEEELAFLRSQKEAAMQAGLTYVVVPEEVYSNFSLDTNVTNSAFFSIRDLISQHSGYNESITIQCLPIYYLEPNTRITVKDEASNIHGDYIINTISLPLAVGGTMSINATRVVERL